MSLLRYKDASRAELLEILQIQMEHSQKLQAANKQIYKDLEFCDSSWRDRFLKLQAAQPEWIVKQLVPALNKCFKSKIGCDGMLIVSVDDYNELVELIKKVLPTPPEGE
jgi:hypothetical protein